MLICCCLYQFTVSKIVHKFLVFFSKMYEKEQVGSGILVIYSMQVPLNEISVPPSCLSPGLTGMQKCSIRFIVGTCLSGLFGLHRCFSRDSYCCFLFFSLFRFLTAEAMVMDPNTRSSLLFCKSQSGSKGEGDGWPELQQRSALGQATK